MNGTTGAVVRGRQRGSGLLWSCRVVQNKTVKGTSLLLTLDLVRERHGDAGLRSVLDALPHELRGQLPAQILPSQQFPFHLWAEVLLTAEHLFGHPLSIARESARKGYRKLFQTTYANWVRRGEPLEALRLMPRLWEQVTKGLGEYEVADAEDGLVVTVRLHVEERYRVVTEERVAGTLEAMIGACGGVGTVRVVRRRMKTDMHVVLRGER